MARCRHVRGDGPPEYEHRGSLRSLASGPSTLTCRQRTMPRVRQYTQWSHTSIQLRGHIRTRAHTLHLATLPVAPDKNSSDGPQARKPTAWRHKRLDRLLRFVCALRLARKPDDVRPSTRHAPRAHMMSATSHCRAHRRGARRRPATPSTPGPVS